jgi:hypothetical protein
MAITTTNESDRTHLRILPSRARTGSFLDEDGPQSSKASPNRTETGDGRDWRRATLQIARTFAR